MPGLTATPNTMTKKSVKKLGKFKKTKAAKKQATRSKKTNVAPTPPTAVVNEPTVAATTPQNTGLGIVPARVKRILLNVGLNQREFNVCLAIKYAETANSDIHTLSAEHVAVINEAEMRHITMLQSNYERDVIASYSDARRRKYKAARLAAKHQNKQEFNLRNFNTKFDSKFYNNLNSYIQEHDTYAIGHKCTSQNSEKVHTQWSRAIALVNKLSTRLGSNSRNIIAAFLDTVVDQYAKNAITNCVNDGRGIVKVSDALRTTNSSDTPLHAFVMTLNHAKAATNWLAQCDEARAAHQLRKKNGEESTLELPAYPVDLTHASFNTYVQKICKLVKYDLSQSADNADKYLKVSLSKEFKYFCMLITYETLLRFGEVLTPMIQHENVKTVSDRLIWTTLNMLYAVVGQDFAPVRQQMNEKLETFNNWYLARKLEKVQAKA